jgi:MFS superfamily sulfate permease-like transporter
MCAYWSEKDALWLIFLLFFGLPLLAMFMAIVLPLFYNHPVIFAGILAIALGVCIVALIKRQKSDKVKKL